MIVLVCGGRAYTDRDVVFRVLDHVASRVQVDVVVHGGAAGADKLADDWARSRAIHPARMDALWGSFGKGSGQKRNAAMLLLRPDLVVAFPGGNGTADMVRRAEAAGIKVLQPPPPATVCPLTDQHP